mmetsp:Transcript_8252/g.24410  ORF Transcript_8252/g.24410 Transcript_8252/m.24410 type:complete len:89 (+) Transcript_8252:220-486(+)
MERAVQLSTAHRVSSEALRWQWQGALRLLSGISRPLPPPIGPAQLPAQHPPPPIALPVQHPPPLPPAPYPRGPPKPLMLPQPDRPPPP